ncbi:hypothetical protein EI94DRAFT_1810791 [Lactarius quietus]|nr:hypothetical protein EI94DRAFT_1810791 [Lactarius quietus]
MDCHRHCGHPLGKKKKTERQVRHSLSSDTPALAEGLQETDSDDDDYGEDKWDLHASTKPSPLDGEASDEQWDPEDEVEDIADEAFNGWMVKMISDLQDDDPCDLEWKPKHKARKRAKSGPRKAPSFGPDVAMKSAQSLPFTTATIIATAIVPSANSFLSANITLTATIIPTGTIFPTTNTIPTGTIVPTASATIPGVDIPCGRTATVGQPHNLPQAPMPQLHWQSGVQRSWQ